MPFFFLLLWFGVSHAEISLPFNLLYGQWKQGSVVWVQSSTVSHVTVDKQSLLFDAEGRSVFGLGRDAQSAVIQWQTPEGDTESWTQPIAVRQYDIQNINGLPNDKVNPNPAELEEIKRNNAEIARARKIRDVSGVPVLPFDWPTGGRISGVYGSQRVLNGQPRRPHFGVDIAAPEGTPVVAPADGKVVLTHPSMVLTGKTVMLDHGLGLKSLYIHLSGLTVVNDQAVKRGDLIGYVGKTGRATGPHLHWGVSWFDVQIDPKSLVLTENPLSL